VLADRLEQVYLTSLEGLGSSYRMKGYFILKSREGQDIKVNFEGVAFGGNYGGHNVNVNIDEVDRSRIFGRDSKEEMDDLLSEVQRRLLNNEMVVEYEGIKQEDRDEIGLP
jgi:hypothetical protein